MPNPLLQTDICLLRALDEDGGFTTRDAAGRAGLHADRRAAAIWRKSLLHMRRLGLVDLLDDQKPSAWVRTTAGSAELSERDADTPSSPSTSRVGEE